MGIIYNGIEYSVTTLGRGTYHKGVCRMLGGRPHRAYSDVVIRFGSLMPTYAPLVEINKPDAIRTSSNKLKFSLKVLEETGQVPKIWLEADSIPDEGFPVIGRSRHHMRGFDIALYRNMDELIGSHRSHDYFMKYIQKEKEYRYHVIGGRVIGCTRKYGGDTSAPYWNARSGFKMTTVDPRPSGERLALKVMELAGLDMGAVDMAYSNGSNKPWFFEINTNPGIDSRRTQLYSTALANLIALRLEEVA